jgi:hypothetical protein
MKSLRRPEEALGKWALNIVPATLLLLGVCSLATIIERCKDGHLTRSRFAGPDDGEGC